MPAACLSGHTPRPTPGAGSQQSSQRARFFCFGKRTNQIADLVAVGIECVTARACTQLPNLDCLVARSATGQEQRRKKKRKKGREGWVSATAKLAASSPATYPVANCSPSGLEATERTQERCPEQVPISCPPCVSNIFTVPSSDAVKSSPSPEYASDRTGKACPSDTCQNSAPCQLKHDTEDVEPHNLVQQLASEEIKHIHAPINGTTGHLLAIGALLR
jgi:hypothetical protein